MSRKNGDRSRYNRMRKAKMHDRERMREIRKTLKPVETPAEPKPEANPA